MPCAEGAQARRKARRSQAEEPPKPCLCTPGYDAGDFAFAIPGDRREPAPMPRKRPPPDTEPDFFDYLNIFSERLPEPPSPRVYPLVTDDWSGQVPIGQAELQITEAYLEKVLAELFGPLP